QADRARLHSRRNSRQFESRNKNRRFKISIAGSANLPGGRSDQRRPTALCCRIGTTKSSPRPKESSHAVRHGHRPHDSPSKEADMDEKIKSRSRRAIPAVNKILDSLGEKAGPAQIDLPRPLIVDVVRQELTQIRRQRQIPDFAAIVDLVQASLEKLRASRIQPVINGTGVVIHTNLGRSPLPQGAGETLRNTASSYNNLELDLTTGDRGGRDVYLERALALLYQTEAATVLHNRPAGLGRLRPHFT